MTTAQAMTRAHMHMLTRALTAGLIVLRCCNHCEIVGTIKGEKRFKGAHWHCYCCRNGFNRRDEAIKHYKTHFRNHHTTFQIQVTQLASVVQANVKMFEELKLYRSAENSQQRIDQLVKSLEKQHRTLIHTQLASLRTELPRLAGTAAPINGHSELTVSFIGEEATGPGEMTLLKEEPSETRVEGEGGALTMGVVQMGPDPGDLVSILGDVCLVAGQEAESSVPELYSVDSGRGLPEFY
ncbi:uncharacterized protein LOC129863840 [Salvelinus fontinalis]|uniref:uncharacterized protein LOC129863840 n=1 Tax=Salvelinus fontinalis TaxID=8038 RepID=UPI0024866C74|nr:uncharacterized protein LOC129863840 [Salvelinus fontinalis]XP_055792133.1 uncharacterized protein LOC129863840 [Salvelinus fontinalis]